MINEKVHINDLDKHTGEEKEILLLFGKIQESMINKNIENLKRFYTPNSTLQHISGKIQTREEFYKELEEGILNYYQSQLKDYEINIKGDMATLTGTCILDAKVYGSKGTWTLKMWRCFKKINNTWFADKEKYN